MEEFTFELPYGKIVANKEDLLRAMILLETIVNAHRHNDPSSIHLAVRQATHFVDELFVS